ncbi:MAG: hypothetical protein AAF969_12925 [Bacteroidota bacterium]
MALIEFQRLVGNQIRMYKIIFFSFVATIACLSCKTAEKEIDHLDLAKQYYKALDDSDDSAMVFVLTDSLLTRETEYDYEQTFSLAQYEEWVKWDAVFEPTYEILSIEQEGDLVKTRISKNDKRIQFLHQGPIVTHQVIGFENNKITRIETTKYEVFNDTLFVKNREEFLGWMDQNHADLNDFIFDQTKEGGLRYLKAMELYNNRK